MAKTLPISATANIFLPIRTNLIKGVALCAAAANSVLEIFDGAIDTIATLTIAEGGSSYSVGDLVTLVEGEFGGTKAILRVTQTDDSSPSSSISTSPSGSLSSSPSSSISTSISTSVSGSVSPSPSASISPSSSISSSPSVSLSISTSISSSPSVSESVSTSISSSPSSSISISISESISTSISSSPSVSESISTSISSSISSSISKSPSSSISISISESISTSISSSPSASLSPSAGAGFITGVEIINPGGGYTAGNTYDTTTDGSGSGAEITVDSVTDVGVSIAKLAAVANESATPLVFDSPGTLTADGVSVRISGSSAKGHLTYE